MRRKSIATHWLSNSFSIVVILLVIIDISCYFVLRSYYYSSVRQFIETEANITMGVVERYYEEQGKDYTEELRTAVEEFENKNYAELMAINPNGRVFLSSSGFTPAESYDMPDYEAAKTADNRRSSFEGRLASGEKYMAFTVVHRKTGNAIRILTSLDKTDQRVFGLSFGVTAVSVIIMILLFILGMYFVRSIAYPVLKLGKTAKELASGDFSARTDVERDDEIGELCTVFNYMADQLQQTENIKNEFISSVSHELRTPLTAIKGWSETVQTIDDEETRRKGMKIITKETERLSQMVEELLDFSRIQNGRFSLQMDNTDVIAELADAVLMYAERAKKDNITLNFEDTDEIAVVYGDKNRLRQVFINIIDNAIKYGKSNGTVDISTKVNSGKIDIFVTDNGCGISASDLPKVKEKFYKANNTVRGSGIGLAVADEIIRMHGGEIDIKSELGKGTKVKITLPTVNKK